MGSKAVRGAPERAAASGVLALLVAVSREHLRLRLVQLAYQRGIPARVAPTLELLGSADGAVLVADDELLATAPSRWLGGLLAVVSIAESGVAMSKLNAVSRPLAVSVESLASDVLALTEAPPASSPKRQQSSVRLHIPPIELELGSRQAWVYGEPLQLRRAELNVLHYLMSHPERVVATQELVVHVLGTTGSGGSARTQVCELRRKLAERGADDVVETVRGTGYRFVRRSRV